MTYLDKDLMKVALVGHKLSVDWSIAKYEGIYQGQNYDKEIFEKPSRRETIVSVPFNDRIKWRLMFFPFGYRYEGSAGMASLYVACDSTQDNWTPSTYMSCAVLFEDYTLVNTHQLVEFEGDKVFGDKTYDYVMEVKNFCPKADLLNMLVDGALRLKVTIEHRHLGLIPFPDTLLDHLELWEQLIDADTADFFLQVGEQAIGVHKLVLDLKWPYYRTMMGLDMVERKANKVLVEGHDYETVRALVVHLYSGLPKLEDVTFAMKVYKAAHQYEVFDLVNICETFILKNIVQDAMHEVLDFATTYELPRVTYACKQLFREKMNDEFPGFDKFLEYEGRFELWKEIFDKIDELAATEQAAKDKEVAKAADKAVEPEGAGEPVAGPSSAAN